jgi:hypothetical protein
MVAFMVAYAINAIVAYTRKRVPRADTIRRPTVYWMAPQRPDRQTEPQYAAAELFDPSLLSLPNRHGFSGALWQHTATPAQRDLPPTIALAYGQSPTNLSLPVLLDRPPLTELVRQNAGGPSAGTGILELEPAAAGTQSVVRAEGALADWPLLQSPELPLLQRDTALRPTLVRVAVTSAGTTLYACLFRSSGDDAVDAQALQWAHEVTFVPRQAPGAAALTWGWLRFQWRTVAGNSN